MKTLLRIFSIFIFIYSSSAYSESLLEIYNLALQQDPTYKSAIAAHEVSKESLYISTAKFKPSVDISSSIGNGSGPKEQIAYSLNLRQTIYNYQDILSNKQIKRQFIQSEAELKTAQQDLIVRVARRYFNVLSAMDNVNFSKAEKEAIARQLDQTKQRFDVGLVAITDVHEARARYDLSVAQGIDAENQLDTALESLREITGQYHESFTKLREDTTLSPPNPNNIDAWTKDALENSLSILIAEEALEQAQYEIKKQRAGFYPTINLTASSGISTSYSETLDNNNNKIITKNTDHSDSIQLSLNMNLYSGGRTNAQIRTAQLNLVQSKENLESVKRKVQKRVRGAYSNVLAGVSRISALDQARTSSESALRASEAGFEVGTRTTVDVLNSRRELFRAENEHSQARYDYVIDRLKLKQAAGSLNEKDLKQINLWLHDF